MSLTDTEGITVGKFYATFLIQEYFRKFKKKRQEERRKKNADNTIALKVIHRITMRVNFEDIKINRNLIYKIGYMKDLKFIQTI